MSRHGHVTPNANGLRARCGGPAICGVCQREQASIGKFLMDTKFDTHSPDGDTWAREFCRCFPGHDLDMIRGWFCNAIMAGWDNANNKAQAKLAILIEAIRDECNVPEGIRQALLKVTGGHA